MQITTNENVSTISAAIIKDKIKLDIPLSDISTAHRLGKLEQSNRAIIVKLCRRDVKKSLFAACRLHKPANFFIRESLTPVRSSIAYALRRMKRQENSRVTGVSTRDGEVFAWIKHAP